MDGAMRVELDVDRCVGSGMCVLAAPDVFDQNEDGVVELLDDHPSAEQRAAVRDAAVRCPASVIWIEEND
jgi:ferredoxin